MNVFYLLYPTVGHMDPHGVVVLFDGVPVGWATGNNTARRQQREIRTGATHLAHRFHALFHCIEHVHGLFIHYSTGACQANCKYFLRKKRGGKRREEAGRKEPSLARGNCALVPRAPIGIG